MKPEFLKLEFSVLIENRNNILQFVNGGRQAELLLENNNNKTLYLYNYNCLNKKGMGKNNY